MKQVLFMAILAAGMLLAGCSKDLESMEDKQLADMKQHIVGTWEHDGDTWYKDISDLGIIQNGIITGCTAEFGNNNPGLLTFNADGTFKLEADGHEDETENGTYTILEEQHHGVNLMWMTFENDPIEKHNSSFVRFFDYHGMVFESDYKTMYLIGGYLDITAGRYRRK